MFWLLAPALLAAPPAGASKLTLKPGYAATRSVPAEHATQAAAADAKHVYAVSNRSVAVHDRATGKLLRVSGGPAEHLNSAFVHAGKVFCAHSNYPKKPDTSDIRVYDPATNKLAVFHDFKDPPGSLAVDPATPGGLVGIDRTKRTVVFAAKPKPAAGKAP